MITWHRNNFLITLLFTIKSFWFYICFPIHKKTYRVQQNHARTIIALERYINGLGKRTCYYFVLLFRWPHSRFSAEWQEKRHEPRNNGRDFPRNASVMVTIFQPVAVHAFFFKPDSMLESGNSENLAAVTERKLVSPEKPTKRRFVLINGSKQKRKKVKLGT